MTSLNFDFKAAHLGQFWDQDRSSLAGDAVWGPFLSAHHTELALAYLISSKWVKETPLAIQRIDLTWIQYCDLLGIDPDADDLLAQGGSPGADSPQTDGKSLLQAMPRPGEAFATKLPRF